MADLALLTSFPPDSPVPDKDYDDAIKNHIRQLEKISPKTWIEGAGSGSDLLDSLPYLYTLLAHVSPYDSPKAANTQPPPPLCPGGAVWGKISRFTSTFDSVQIRYAPKSYTRLLRYVYRVASGLQLPKSAIQPFRDSILRLDPDGGVLTTNHLLVLRTCMSCGEYGEAVPLLEKMIHTFPTKRPSRVDAPYLCSRHAVASAYITEESGFTDEVTAYDVQEYFLLGGMCYIALRMWEEAQIFLEHVLVIPSGGVATGNMVEAYRKWLLVGCLAHGYAPKPPKLVSANALKDLKSVSKPWEALASIFQQGDPARLAAEIDAGQQWWAGSADGGLARELAAHLQRFFVVKLERTYTAVPVATVAQWLRQSPPEAEAYLARLIGTGQLGARIHAEAGGSILRFEPGASGPQGEEQQLRKLQAQAARTSLLAGYVRDADSKLATSKEYVLDLSRREAQRRQAGATNGHDGGAGGASAAAAAAGGGGGSLPAGPPGGFGDEMDITFDGQDGDDEDLMGDV